MRDTTGMRRRSTGSTLPAQPGSTRRSARGSKKLETPIVEGDVAVVPLIQGYGYADASLESLSGAQKQLLRMGPDNVRRVQQKLRAIARELGISESSLPGERVISAQR